MGVLESAVEFLRPIVKSKEWDYCVIWRLGDDPSSFIEWVDCCCGGGDGHSIVKEESGVDAEQHTFPVCRDIRFPHIATTKACEALAKYPSSMSLYSGIHGEVAISNQPLWFTHRANTSNRNCEVVQTQVIIPVVGGLIELSSTKSVPKDQTLIEYITAHYNISLEHEIMAVHSNTNNILEDKPHDPFVSEYLNNQYDHLNFILRQQNIAPCFNIEGSPTGSTPSNAHPSLLPGSSHVLPNKSTVNTLEYCELNSKMELPKNKEIKADLVCSKRIINRKDKPTSRHRTDKEPYQSKNVFIERNRRQRIKDGLFTLRSLVPKISKMDRASILGDAIDYIVDLQKTIVYFQNELKKLEEKGDCSKSSALKQLPEGSTISEQSQEMEVQMEIIGIGKREFLLKFTHSQKQAGFLRLMEAIQSLGLLVVDANVTTCKGKVLNILKIEANGEEIEPNELKDSLLIIWTSKSDVKVQEEKKVKVV